MADPLVTGSPEAPIWAPVAEAATAAGTPLRTLYRWIRAKRLATRREGGKLQVEVGAVQRLASARAEGGATSATPAENAGALAGNLAGTLVNGTVAGTPPRGAPMPLSHPAGDGALAQAAFTLFEEGGRAMDLVRDRGVLPEAALRLWQQWRSLRDAAGETGRATTGERLDAIESSLRGGEGQKSMVERLARLESVLDGVSGPEGPATLAEVLRYLDHAVSADLGQRVATIERVLAELPVPLRGAFTCPACEAKGLLAVSVRCTRCGHDTHPGFYPPAGQEG